ncbi:MAG: ferrous iron transport protein A [Paenirhodobacter sp.]|uniref:FeoA family protein n=1 Tax=Paenirhodobacter sp. TaxID=1965326 RepID=UPI003D0EACF4
MKLREFRPGESGRVSGFRPGSKLYRRKLLAMGMTPGAEFTVTRLAPLGDPIELRLRGFALTLRKADAEAIEVERTER